MHRCIYGHLHYAIFTLYVLLYILRHGLQLLSMIFLIFLPLAQRVVFSSFNSAVIIDFSRFCRRCFRSLRITWIFRIFSQKKKGAKCPPRKENFMNLLPLNGSPLMYNYYITII